MTVPTGRETFEAVVPLQPIDFRTGNPVPWEMIAAQHPGLNMSRVADTKWSLSPDHTLYMSWVTDLEYHGTAVLRQGAPNASSALKPLSVTSWAEFKEYVTSLEPNRYIFRGHEENTWRLRTYFHRTGRADLRRFMRVDIPVLHRHLSGMTSACIQLDRSHRERSLPQSGPASRLPDAAPRLDLLAVRGGVLRLSHHPERKPDCG